MGKKLVLPLCLSPSMVLCPFVFVIVAEQLEQIVKEFGHLLQFETVLKISLKYFGSGSLIALDGQDTLGDTSNLTVLNTTVHEISSLDGPTTVSIDLNLIIVNSLWHRQFTKWICQKISGFLYFTYQPTLEALAHY